MILSRSRIGREVLRLVLAAVLFLSAVAGARMQGEMGGLALALGSHGAALCSGAPVPVTGDDQDRSASADHCQLCVAPALGPITVTGTISAVRGYVTIAFTEVAAARPADPIICYGARGPPQAV